MKTEPLRNKKSLKLCWHLSYHSDLNNMHYPNSLSNKHNTYLVVNHDSVGNAFGSWNLSSWNLRCRLIWVRTLLPGSMITARPYNLCSLVMIFLNQWQPFGNPGVVCPKPFAYDVNAHDNSDQCILYLANIMYINPASRIL